MRLAYLKNGESLVFKSDLCTGCRECVEVCPHAVFVAVNGTVAIRDRGACMQCGACARNCAAGAISVKAGVGCAAAVINGLIRGTEPTCGCGGSESRHCCDSSEAYAGPAKAPPGCC